MINQRMTTMFMFLQLNVSQPLLYINMLLTFNDSLVLLNECFLKEEQLFFLLACPHSSCPHFLIEKRSDRWGVEMKQNINGDMNLATYYSFSFIFHLLSVFNGPFIAINVKKKYFSIFTFMFVPCLSMKRCFSSLHFFCL